jgi:hypothetical protein
MSNSCRVCYRYDCVGFVVRTGVERRRVTITLSERERLYFNFFMFSMSEQLWGAERATRFYGMMLGIPPQVLNHGKVTHETQVFGLYY